MRQAVNLAIDRRALARRLSCCPDEAPGRPTDQFIPPGLPGFHDEAIYPLGGPDIDAARRLAGSGRGRRMVFYTCNNPACLEQARIVRRNLAAIGLDIEVKSFPFAQMFRRLATPGEPWDLGSFGWLMDFADAANFTASIFLPESEPRIGESLTPSLVRRLRAAGRLSDEARANAFAKLDAELSRAGTAVPFATAATTELFSDRIGCQVHQPLYGISLGSLCVRP
jgi:ABC-type transport system substrate-binding protein